MCGIVGYIGERQADPLLRDTLQRLTYRGYDSAGISVEGERLRTVGTVDDLPGRTLAGTCGIGHTRWATHGGVTETNAHPHTDAGGDVFVVHNGIVENADTLREELPGPFVSETDTEVIPHAIAAWGLSGTVDRLRGQYAFVAMRDGRLTAVRQHCPLVVGYADHGVFVASDVNALRGRVDRVAHLQTGDTVRLPGADLPTEPLDGEAGRLNKGGHAHWTIKEIYEQPYALGRTPNPAALDAPVWFIGAGSSAYAAQWAAARSPRPDRWAVASEFDPEEPPEHVVAISQSGETADVLAALRRADADSVTAVTNGDRSELARRANRVVDINAGPEIGVAATKTWTASLITLSRLIGRPMSEVIDDCRTALDASDAIYDLASTVNGAVLFIGSGANLAVANEAALKCQELAYVPAWAFPAGELKHGPLALVDDDTYVIGCDDHANALREADARGATTLALDDYGTVGTTTWAYLFAYHLARLRGRSVDRPRNLAKSVTV